MVDSLTIVAWAFSTVKSIAESGPGKKFIESTIGEVAKQMTGAGINKIDQLRQFIIQKLQGNQAAEEALARVEHFGSEDDLRDIANYLDMALRKDLAFSQQVQTLMQDLQSLVQVQDDSYMTQVNRDSAKGWQTKVQGGTAYIGEIHIHEK